jgi:hypothetical protein
MGRQLLVGLLWLLLPQIASSSESVFEVFPPPAAAARVEVDSFGLWLRGLKVNPAGDPINAYDGSVIPHNGRVLDLAMVKGNLQQCADSAIRLRAEWLREKKKPIVFHATSGDPLPWARYRDGERPFEEGGRIKWKPAAAGSWDGYLTRVFMWAGTRSLGLDTVVVESPLPGDMLVIPGSPGHAVVLLDVAVDGEQTYVLIGEGYMPAQEFHVELGPQEGWWLWREGLILKHWDMRRADLLRWKP